MGLMANQDYSQELHNLMLNVVQYNLGAINLKQLMTEIDKLKTRLAKIHLQTHISLG